MSPLLVLHATRVACRDSIRAHGLLPACPQDGRPFGVYAYSDGIRNRGFRCRRSDGTPRNWIAGYPGVDVWQASYIGPMAPDVYIANGIILFDPVPPEHVTLVTCND